MPSCRTCTVDLLVEAFRPDRRYATGHQPVCLTCQKPPIKRCRTCGEEKPRAAYQPSGRGPSGLNDACRLCEQQRKGDAYQTNAEAFRERQRSYNKANIKKLRAYDQERRASPEVRKQRVDAYMVYYRSTWPERRAVANNRYKLNPDEIKEASRQ